jgi:hypothetical protein
MKKPIMLSAVLLFVFGMTFGIVLTLNEDAMAIDECSWECQFRLYCSSTTGPNCGGYAPYYVFRKSTCTGGPLNCPFVNEWIGCWSGVEPCRPLIWW